MILVTGATGNTASKLVWLLAEAGVPDRALVRSPEKGSLDPPLRCWGGAHAVAEPPRRGGDGQTGEGQRGDRAGPQKGGQ